MSSGVRLVATVEAILSVATLEEKVATMSGRGAWKQMQQSGWGGDPYRAGGSSEASRLKSVAIEV